MSHRRTPHDVNTPGLFDHDCTHCGAVVDAYCTLPSGYVAPWQHSARYRVVRDLEKETHL